MGGKTRYWNWSATLADYVQMDKRSIALFRVLLGAVILLDIILRWEDINDFYTEDGILPLRSILQFNSAEGFDFLSLFYISDSYFFSCLLFIMYGCSAFTLMLGFHANLSALICWIFLTSLHNRVPLIQNGGDVLLRMALLWASFLPLSSCYSIYSLFGPNRDHLDLSKKMQKSKKNHSQLIPLGDDNSSDLHSRSLSDQSRSCSDLIYRFAHIAVFGWWFQLASMYIFSYFEKYGESWINGTALQITLQNDYFLTPFGHFVRELLFPTSFFSTASNSTSPITLPSPHYFSSPIFELETSLMIMKILSKGVLYLELIGPFLLLFPTHRFKVLRDVTVVSFILLHVGFGSMLYVGLFIPIPIICNLSFLTSNFWDIYLPFIANRFTKLVSIDRSDRSSFPKTTKKHHQQLINHHHHHHHHHHQNESTRMSEVLKVMIIIVLIVHCGWWNIAGCVRADVPSAMMSLSVVFRIDQFWDMFAPNPPSYYGWFYIPGRLLNGQMINMMEGLGGSRGRGGFGGEENERRKIGIDPPPFMSHQYTNDRWRKFFFNFNFLPSFAFEKLAFGQYICKKWNYPTGIHLQNQQLQTFEIWFFRVDINPDISQPRKEPVLEVAWAHQCLSPV